MDKALLDTDIVSEIIKARDPRVVQRASEYHTEFGAFTISTLTVLEIVKGFRKLNREDRIQRFIQFVEYEDVVAFDLEAAEAAGRIYADLQSAGRPIGRIDPMIAAIAVCHHLTLVTGNTAHYECVRQVGYELKLDNWRADPAEPTTP